MWQALKFNTSITIWHINHNDKLLPIESIHDCFQENSSIVETSSYGRHSQVEWYAERNRVCKELGLGKAHRDSVPLNLPMNQIEPFLEAAKESEPWKAMKLVVLGHGRIGKSTLVHQLKEHVAWKNSNSIEKLKTLFTVDKTMISTIGIDCETVQFYGGEVTIHDFGGQLEYSTTHHLFLSSEMVAYLVCFDLGATMEEQTNQVSYWLSFLDSSLPLPTSISGYNGRWTIFLVGLRSDLHKQNYSINFQSNHLQAWRRNWPRLPLFNQIFNVSSFESAKSVRTLFKVLGNECDRIFRSYSVLIPTSYSEVLNLLQVRPNDQCFVTESELKEQVAKDMQVPFFYNPLHYLHAIGRIVRFSNGLVCTNASIAPKIVAKFVSPEDVRLKLLTNQYNVQILSKEEVGCLLDIDTSSNERLFSELELLVALGVCFKLYTQDAEKMYFLFPALSLPSSDFKFSIPYTSMFQFAGIQFKATNNTIFVPGFYNHLIVKVLAKLNES